MSDGMENGTARVSYFVAGVGLGALIGVLFAPRSGQETRDVLAQKAGEGRSYAQRKARDLRYRAEDLVERGKQAVRQQSDAISQAVDAGREAYQAEMPPDRH